MRGLVLALVLGATSAFIPGSPAAMRAAARVKQTADPWFPDAVATVKPTGAVQTEAYKEAFLEAQGIS